MSSDIRSLPRTSYLVLYYFTMYVSSAYSLRLYYEYEYIYIYIYVYMYVCMCDINDIIM